jgi:hypothetical protein
LPQPEAIAILRRQISVEVDQTDSGSESQNDAPTIITLDDLASEEQMIDLLHDIGGAEPRPRDEIRGWEELRQQIKEDLKRAHKNSKSLTCTNQLLILRNFATLHLKGVQRIAMSEEITRQWDEGVSTHFTHQVRFLVHHYQLFEQLPVEKRGGDRGWSMLNNEKVQAVARTYLFEQRIGDVTPQTFHRALNERILPSLGYSLKSELSERTARRWLLKLGWRRKELKKGVYMDGHERSDVVEYRNKVFLTLMAKYE